MAGLNDLVMPKLGLTMTEGTLTEWAVAPGDAVRPGAVMFVVETDKVATEIVAEAAGELREIVVAAGETVAVGAVVARWTGPGQGRATEDPPPDAVPAGPTLAQTARPPGDRIIATPLARRLAREAGVDLAAVTGTGPRGRIKAADVRAALTLPAAPTQAPGDEPAPGARGPASPLVQAMARRMTEAKQVPHFYLGAEAEVTELLALRERLNTAEGFARLTLNHFVLAAVARALELTPAQNRIFAAGEIVQFETVDVGIAVNTDRGLVAPVLHDLAGRGIDEIAARARNLQARVHAGRATREDMQGGAITVSNGGMHNVTNMTPIINPPQSAILGVGSVRELFRPGADGEPRVHREIGLVLAGDHRIHDGVGGLTFLNRVIGLLQEPWQLLRPVPTQS